MSLTVRDLTAADEPRWRELWAGFLDFYEHPLPEEVTAATFGRLLAREEGMRGKVAIADDGQVVGFVHTVVHAGTWSVAPRCYLEDLFVASEVRGTGAGRALIEAARDHAAALGCSEMYWITDSGNVTARRLYDRVAKLADYVRYEIELA